MPSLWVSCSACGAAFPAETHAGMVRCATCADRAMIVFPSQRRVVVL